VHITNLDVTLLTPRIMSTAIIRRRVNGCLCNLTRQPGAHFLCALLSSSIVDVHVYCADLMVALSLSHVTANGNCL
jgi:hypothetical protein